MQKYISNEHREKFKKLFIFCKIVPRLYEECKESFNDTIKEKLIKLGILMMVHCNFRVGNRKYYKKNKTTGVLTMKKKNIKCSKNGCEIKYIGKYKKENACFLSFSKLPFDRSKILKMQDEQHPEDVFLSANKVKVTVEDLNNFLKRYNRHLTTPVIRLYRANQLFLEKILNVCKEIDILSMGIMQRQKIIFNSIKHVASKMFHTAKVCRRSYIIPKLHYSFVYHPNIFLNYFNERGNENRLDRLAGFINNVYLKKI